jgi:hypothetical protein
MTATDESYFVSRSGTKHMVGPQSSKLQAGRISALCGFSCSPEDELFEALRNCEFCEEEAAAARHKAEAKALEQIRNGVAEALIESEKANAPVDQILS